MLHRVNRRIVLILKLLVAGGLITWLLKSDKINLDDVATVGERWPWLAAALVPFGLVLFICAYRVKVLLAAQGIRYSLRDAFAITMVGHFFNQFLIGTTGGDMVKAYTIAMEQPGRRGGGIMAVFVDRAIGLLVLVAVALVAIGFNLDLIRGEPRLAFLAGMVTAVFVASLIGGYVFYSERIRSLSVMRWVISKLPFRETIAKVAEAVYVYKYHPRHVIVAVLASVVVHVLIVVMHLCLARSLISEPLPWVSFFFLIPLAQIAMAIPINPPGAIGTGEWIYATLLPFVGVPQGALICIFQRFVVCYAWALVGCVYYLRRRAKVGQAVEAARVADEGAAEKAEPCCAGGVGDDAAATHGDRNVRTGVDSGAV